MAYQRCGLTVFVVLERALAVEIQQGIRPRHGEFHPEAEQHRLLVQVTGIPHLLTDLHASVPVNRIGQGHFRGFADQILGRHDLAAVHRLRRERAERELRIEPLLALAVQVGAQIILRQGASEARHRRIDDHRLAIQFVSTEETGRLVEGDLPGADTRHEAGPTGFHAAREHQGLFSVLDEEL